MGLQRTKDKVGSVGLAFTLRSQLGAMVSLRDFVGKKPVVHFYPEDDTPGCTREVCAC
jgi:peroxiredoxin Q/BCP